MIKSHKKAARNKCGKQTNRCSPFNFTTNRWIYVHIYITCMWVCMYAYMYAFHLLSTFCCHATTLTNRFHFTTLVSAHLVSSYYNDSGSRLTAVHLPRSYLPQPHHWKLNEHQRNRYGCRCCS